MATVYIVTHGEYSDYGIDAVFSDREKADRFAAELEKAVDGQRVQVAEWTVDEKAEAFARPIYLCYIDRDGNAEIGAPRYMFVSERYTKMLACDSGRCYGESAVSAEHAMKLAVEARQKWLREHSAAPGRLLPADRDVYVCKIDRDGAITEKFKISLPVPVDYHRSVESPLVDRFIGESDKSFEHAAALAEAALLSRRSRDEHNRGYPSLA